MEESHKLEIKQAGTRSNLDVVWFKGVKPTQEQIENAMDESLNKLSECGGVTAQLTTHYFKSNKNKDN